MLLSLKELLISLNKNGIPVPLVRDPKIEMGSVSLTLVFISSIYVQIGLIGKFSHWFDIDMTSAITWFGLCMGLYHFNKRISFQKETGLILESQSSTEEKEKVDVQNTQN